MMEKKQFDEFASLLTEDGILVGEGDFAYRELADSGEGTGARGFLSDGASSGSWLALVLTVSPGNRFALVVRSPYAKDASLLKGGVRPYLDDMAQMIGLHLAVRDRGKRPFRLGVNSAVLLRGEGAVLAADSLYELRALALVVEKSCLAAVAAPLLGGAHSIPLFEALLMRCIYLLKYRKTAGRAKSESAYG